MMTPMCWMGGKSKMKNRIVKLMPPHTTYVEPFVGGASVFFAKQPAAKSIINDIDPHLIGFYKEFKNKGCDFALKCRPINSKKTWESLKVKKSNGGKMGACEFVNLVKRSYGCQMSTFNAKGNNAKNGFVNMKKGCSDIQNRLKKTTILNQDFRSVVKKYDGKNTFFYVDPPYHKLSCSYAKCDIHPQQVCSILKKAKGKFLLSYNNHPDVRKACAGRGIYFKKIKTKYEQQRSMSGTFKPVTELLISNYKFKKVKK